MEDWIIFALLSGALFGATNLFIRNFAGKAGAGELIAVTGLGITLTGIAIAYFSGSSANIKLPGMQEALPYVIGFALVWAFGTFAQIMMYSQKSAQLSSAGVLSVSVICITTFILGIIAFGEKPNSWRLAGFVLALAGAALLSA